MPSCAHVAAIISLVAAAAVADKSPTLSTVEGDVLYQSGAGVTKNLTGLVTEEAAAQGLARVQRSSDATVADLLNQLVESGKAGLQGEKEAAEAIAGSIDKVVKAMAAQSAKAEQASSTASGRKLELPTWVSHKANDDADSFQRKIVSPHGGAVLTFSGIGFVDLAAQLKEVDSDLFSCVFTKPDNKTAATPATISGGRLTCSTPALPDGGAKSKVAVKWNGGSGTVLPYQGVKG